MTGTNVVMCRFLVVFSFLWVAACTSHVSVSNSDAALNDELGRIETVIVASDVEVVLVSANGEFEKIGDKEDQIRSRLNAYLTKWLYNNSYLPVQAGVDGKSSAQSNTLESFSIISDELFYRREPLNASSGYNPDLTSFDFRLRPSALSSYRDVDAMLLARYRGFEKSAGYIATDIGVTLLSAFLTNGSHALVSTNSSFGVVDFALIDISSGKVLWNDANQGKLNHKIAVKAMKSLPKRMGPLSSDTLKQQMNDIENKLSSSDIDELDVLSREIYHYVDLSPDLLDVLEKRIIRGMNTSESINEDTVAWWCKILGKSGDSRFRETLDYVVANTRSAKIKKHAIKAIKNLPVQAGHLEKLSGRSSKSRFDDRLEHTNFVQAEIGESQFSVEKLAVRYGCKGLVVMTDKKIKYESYLVKGCPDDTPLQIDCNWGTCEVLD